MNIEQHNRLITEGRSVTVSHDYRIRGGRNQAAIEKYYDYIRLNGAATIEQIDGQKDRVKTMASWH